MHTRVKSEALSAIIIVFQTLYLTSISFIATCRDIINDRGQVKYFICCLLLIKQKTAINRK